MWVGGWVGGRKDVPAVVDADAAFEEGEEGDDLGQGLVLFGQGVDGVVEDLFFGGEMGGWVGGCLMD